MQNNENNYEGAKRKQRKKNKQTKKHIAKKNLVRGHSFMSIAKKSLKFGYPVPTLSTNNQFWSELNPLLKVANWHSITPG